MLDSEKKIKNTETVQKRNKKSSIKKPSVLDMEREKEGKRRKRKLQS